MTFDLDIWHICSRSHDENVFLLMDSHYYVMCFWLFVELILCVKLVGATSSEGFLLLFSFIITTITAIFISRTETKCIVRTQYDVG